MRHYEPGPVPPQKTQQLIDQSALRIFARDRGLKDVRVADSFHAAQGLLSFQPINSGLHRRIRWSALLGKCLLNLANGTRAFLPERLEYLHFQPGKS